MYTQPIDRNHPGCILFLVDQSASMNDSFAGTAKSKATALAQAVNRLILNLVLQCQRGVEVRDYYMIGIIGYGHEVGPAFGGSLTGHQLVPISRIADYPLRMTTDSLPGSPDLSIELPVWIDPKANGGTPMTAGIDLAGSFLVDWANDNVDSFPPIVVNISDGGATDGDPRTIAAQLRDIRTNDGNLLLFNINLTDHASSPIEYPNSPRNLPNTYAVGLFEMSSELTPYMLAVARSMDLPVAEGARGFVFNADAAKLSEFLDVGTRVSQVADR
jgi:hypothetical protein